MVRFIRARRHAADDLQVGAARARSFEIYLDGQTLDERPAVKATLYIN
jgi:hypothetical protein